MNRIVRMLAALVGLSPLCLGAPARADGRPAPPPVTPSSPTPTPVAAPLLRARDVELLPLPEDLLARFATEAPAVLPRVAELAHGVERLKDTSPSRGRAEAWLLRSVLLEQLERAASELAERWVALGGDVTALGAIARTPLGPGRVSRYARSRVLAVPDLDAAQRAVLEACLASVEAATSGREAEERFWRVADAVLSDGQKREVRRSLPARVALGTARAEQLLAVPELTLGQEARLEALKAEFEAETAPDTAAVKAARSTNVGATSSSADARAARREAARAEARLFEARIRVLLAAREVLTPAQRLAWDATLPFVGPFQRARGWRDVVASIELAPAQRARLARLASRARAAAMPSPDERRASDEVREAFGEESVQADAVDRGRLLRRLAASEAALAAGRELFTSILTPAQISSWVAAPAPGPTQR